MSYVKSYCIFGIYGQFWVSPCDTIYESSLLLERSDDFCCVDVRVFQAKQEKNVAEKKFARLEKEHERLKSRHEKVDGQLREAVKDKSKAESNLVRAQADVNRMRKQYETMSKEVPSFDMYTYQCVCTPVCPGMYSQSGFRYSLCLVHFAGGRQFPETVKEKSKAEWKTDVIRMRKQYETMSKEVPSFAMCTY